MNRKTLLISLFVGLSTSVPFPPVEAGQQQAMLLAFLAGCNEAKTAQPEELLLVEPGVAYHPRGFSPMTERWTLSREQITEDLRLLRKAGFRSLVTYGAHGLLGVIPEIARMQGFDGTVVMGLWDPSSEEEWKNALSQSSHVDGYCVGNEGLGIRYQPNELTDRMAELRHSTGRPVTTSEPIDSYLRGPYRNLLLAHSDWLFPLAHPFWASQVDPLQAVDWILARHDYLAAATGRSVMLKEAGLPTGGLNGCNEEAQIVFFDELEAADLSFFYFEAFDQPWKRDLFGNHEVEAHWGLYRADGTAKGVVSWFVDRWSRR